MTYDLQYMRVVEETLIPVDSCYKTIPNLKPGEVILVEECERTYYIDADNYSETGEK